jgi:hypothetical protein
MTAWVKSWMFADCVWEWLTHSLIFTLYYALASITIILFVRFHIGIEFVARFCLGGAAALSCVIISDLHPPRSRIQTTIEGERRPQPSQMG